MIRIGIIQFPGSNCERETILAVKRAGMDPVEFLWNESLDKLRNLDGYILVGGFSYEDRSRAGIIAALDPVVTEIKQQSAQGKPILGLCNGAQILVEAGMFTDFKQADGNKAWGIALTDNKRIVDGKLVGIGYYNAWVTICLAKNYQPNAFIRLLSKTDVICLPVANAEGRFVMPDTLFQTLQQQGLAPFVYCDTQGEVIGDFPINPNGSLGNIAAIINKTGNVMAMMPHPERTKNGDVIFASMRDYIVLQQKKTIQASVAQHSIVNNQHQFMKSPTLMTYSKLRKTGHYLNSYQCLVKLIITDNHALTVQNTLKRLGFPVIVNRFVHWEIACDEQLFDMIKKSGVLYSPRKECELSSLKLASEQTLSYLVRQKDDIVGQRTLQRVKEYLLTKKIQKNLLKTIQYGVVWQFKSKTINLHELVNNILLTTNIIGTQYAHECYEYDY